VVYLGFNFKVIKVLVLVIISLSLFGCVGSGVRDFNIKFCNKLIDDLGSDKGSICAQDMIDQFSVELEEYRRFEPELVERIYFLAPREGFLGYHCSTKPLEAWLSIGEAGFCNGRCEQDRNYGKCSVGDVGLEEDLGSVLDFLDVDSSCQPISDNYCGSLFRRLGHQGIETGYSDSESWLKASFCDPRQCEEDMLVNIECTTNERPSREGPWEITAEYTSCTDLGGRCNQDGYGAECILVEEDVVGEKTQLCEDIASIDLNLDPGDPSWRCCKGELIQEGLVTCCDGELVSIFGAWSGTEMNNVLSEEVSYRYSSDNAGPYFIACIGESEIGECRTLGGASEPTGNANEYRFIGLQEFTEKLFFCEAKCRVLVGDQVDEAVGSGDCEVNTLENTVTYITKECVLEEPRDLIECEDIF